MLKKKIWANFQRIVEVFTQQIFNMLSNIWVWDPGSGKNPFRISDPRVKKAPDPGSGSATLLAIENFVMKERERDLRIKYACKVWNTLGRFKSSP
jgi:hypothetical protein